MDKDNNTADHFISSRFETLFHQHYEALVRYATTITKDMENAEDIVQSTFLDLWKARGKTTMNDDIKAYLYKGVYFKCLNLLQHQKVKDKYHLHLVKSDDTINQDILVTKELEDRIENIIATLPEQCRKIFTMHKIESKKYKEIAETLSISPKTVENQMGKALKIMREALSDFLPFFIITFTLLQ